LVQVDLGRMDALGKLIKNYAAQISEHLGFRSPGAHPAESRTR
jgi:hypothetical protein